MEPLNITEIKNFARRFQDYRDDYILIGGAACHLWFASRSLDFRRTADMDLVLVIRSQSRPFSSGWRNSSWSTVTRRRN